MLSNEQRIRVYEGSIIAAVIIVGLWLNYAARLQLRDVRVLNEVAVFASAVELYKREHNRYPAGDRVDIRTRAVLSDLGFVPGERVYYQGSIPSKKPATYQSDQEQYAIVFSLRADWTSVGIGGKDCLMTTGMQLNCGKQ